MPDTETPRGRTPLAGVARRTVVAAGFAALVAALASALAADVAWVAESLTRAGASLDPLTGGRAPPQAMALLGIGALAGALAVGTFLVSGETATAFAVLAAATVAWLALPYAEVPWAAVLTGGEPTPRDPPASVWLLSGAIVALATVEVLASGRDHLVATLRRKGLSAGRGTPAGDATRSARNRLVVLVLVVGSLLAGAYAAGREALARLFAGPDLLWVPIALGVLSALALWWAVRRR